MMKYGLVLFTMLLAAPIVVEGTPYYVGLIPNEDNDEELFPIQAFKDSDVASGITVKDIEADLGVLYVEATAAQAALIKASDIVQFVEEDEMAFTLDPNDKDADLE